MPEVVHGTDRRPLETGKTLFDYADEVSVAVPQSCRRSGRCRECVVEVRQGGASLSSPTEPEEYLPDDYRLACQASIGTWRNVRHLVESGVEYGLMTDHPVTLSRDLLLQTRWFLRFGLSKQDAIELVSRRNAELLKLDDILGTLARGKWASFTGWSGDPFDLASRPEAVFAEGEPISECGVRNAE